MATAVKIGSTVEISGTVAMEGDKILADTPYEETKAILKRIEMVLNEAGASMKM